MEIILTVLFFTWYIGFSALMFYTMCYVAKNKETLSYKITIKLILIAMFWPTFLMYSWLDDKT